MKRNGWVILAVLVLTQALVVSSNTAGATTRQAPAQEITKEEADAYKLFFDANQAKDFPKAYESAKAYLGKFPSGKYAKWLKDTGLPRVRGNLFNQAMNDKNIGEMIRLGKEALAENPDNLDYLFLLSFSIKQHELFASPAKFSHAAEASDFTQRTIKLIEAGKAPNVIPKDKWNQNLQLAGLYQTLAVIEVNNKNPEKALDLFKKSSDLDPTDHYNFYIAGTLYQSKYMVALQKFKAFPEADQQNPDNKPEVKAALEDANKQIDALIDTWARFMALTAANNPYGAKRDEIGKVLGDLYKYRHPDSPDGLQKLIEQHKPGSNPNGANTPTSN